MASEISRSILGDIRSCLKKSDIFCEKVPPRGIFGAPVFTRESTFWPKMANISPLRSSKMHDIGAKISFEVV